MKTKILMAIMAVFLMVGSTMAQQRPRGERRNITPKERAERMTEHMAKELSLSDEQKQQLLELNLQQAEQRMGQRPPMNDEAKKKPRKHREGKDSINPRPARGNRQAFMEKMQTERKAYDEKLQQILTKEQYETYTKNMKERRGKNSRPGRR